MACKYRVTCMRVESTDTRTPSPPGARWGLPSAPLCMPRNTTPPPHPQGVPRYLFKTIVHNRLRMSPFSHIPAAPVHCNTLVHPSSRMRIRIRTVPLPSSLQTKAVALTVACWAKQQAAVGAAKCAAHGRLPGRCADVSGGAEADREACERQSPAL